MVPEGKKRREEGEELDQGINSLRLRQGTTQKVPKKGDRKRRARRNHGGGKREYSRLILKGEEDCQRKKEESLCRPESGGEKLKSDCK